MRTARGEGEARWHCRQLGNDTLFGPPSLLEYKVHTLASPLYRPRSAFCYSFHSTGRGSGGLAGWPAWPPPLLGSSFHSSSAESLTGRWAPSKALPAAVAAPNLPIHPQMLAAQAGTLLGSCGSV